MIEAAVAPLREQLAHERGRADRAEQQIEALRSELTEARIAERVAATEATDLRRQLDTEAGEHHRLTALLTDRLTTPSSPTRRWWPWGRRA